MTIEELRERIAHMDGTMQVKAQSGPNVIGFQDIEQIDVEHIEGEYIAVIYLEGEK